VVAVVVAHSSVLWAVVRAVLKVMEAVARIDGVKSVEVVE
jgi:hypothetical protein